MRLGEQGHQRKPGRHPGRTIDARTRIAGSLSALVAAALLSACARNLPARKPTAALYRDLQRLVTVAEAGEWKVDRIEVRELLPDALLSVCRADERTRAELGAWLDAEIGRRGGPVVTAYRRQGRDLDRVEHLLELTRIRMVLSAADEASTGDCPFWLEPQTSFAGRQISDDRWQLSGGGGGRANLVLQGEREDLSFGGAGRLLVGRAIGDRYALYTGAEVGGQASFPRDEDGERTRVQIDFELAVPLVLRYRMVNSYIELEPAYLVSLDESDLEGMLEDASQGFRIGVSFGARALLARWFFPGAAFQILYDRIDPDSAPARHTIRLGFRVAFDLNL